MRKIDALANEQMRKTEDLKAHLLEQCQSVEGIVRRVRERLEQGREGTLNTLGELQSVATHFDLSCARISEASRMAKALLEAADE